MIPFGTQVSAAKYTGIAITIDFIKTNPPALDNHL